MVASMEYSPLNPDLNEIRLLTLLPDDSRRNGLVSCHLDHVSLINPPEYVALSYCWGDASVTKDISINGSSVPVTANLEIALRHLRIKEYGRLWVDAICINQEDKIEKSQQLLWMGSIYQRAREVASWIGENTVQSRFAMNLAIKVPQSPGYSGSEVSAVLEFFDRPYWRRVWVIQELALARHTVVHCGESNVNWPQIVTLVSRYGISCRQMLGISFPKSGIGYMEKLLSFHQHASTFKPLSFLEALLRSSGSLSTDPRDKVFALLGLVHDSRLYIPVPNYRQSVEDICLAMTLSVIATTSRLEIIPLLGSGYNKDNKMASWIPNWVRVEQFSARQITELLEYFKAPEREAQNEDRLAVQDTFASPRPRPGGSVRPVVTTESRVLRISAILLDEVDGLTLTVSESGAPQDAEPLRANSIYSANPYSDNRQRLAILLRTLLQYTVQPEKFSLPVEPLRLLFAQPLLLVKMLDVAQMNWLLAAKNLVVNGQSLLDTTLSCERDDMRVFSGYKRGYTSHSQFISFSASRDREELFQALQDQLNKGMRLMTTKRGFMGWVHPAAEQGDVICLLENCEILVALRPRSEGGYYVIGDLYSEELQNVSYSLGKSEPWVRIDIH
jgi:hypothetical protein